MSHGVPFPSSGTPDAPTGNRRSVFYQTHSSVPFSRSAARRQSVMALGSIEHLQHQFVKFGLGAPGSKSGGARGAGSAFGGAPMMVEEPEELDGNEGTSKGGKPAPFHLARVKGLVLEDGVELPPSPARPETDRRMPWEIQGDGGRSVKGERELRREVLAGLEAVCEKWGLITTLSHPPRRPSSRASYSESDRSRLASPEPGNRPFSALSIRSDDDTASHGPSLILDLLQTTTAAIRSVQQYVVSLPPDAFAPARSSSIGTPPPSVRSRSSRLSFLPNSPPTGPSHETPPTPTPLQTLRQSSLLVLGALKTLESRYRVVPALQPDPPSPSSDSPIPALSHSSDSAPSASSAEDLDAVGFEYTPAELTELVEESRVVRDYVEVVDRVLFRDREKKKAGGPGSGRRKSFLPGLGVGSEEDGESEGRFGRRRSRRVMSGDDSFAGPKDEEAVESVLPVPSVVLESDGEPDEESESDDELPEWAVMTGGLQRTYAILAANLPERLVARLVDPAFESRELFHESLSDGTLLCTAYNAVLRASSKPFGFIPDRSIHDLAPDVLSSTPTGDEMAQLAASEPMRRVSSIGTSSSGGGDAKERDKVVGATFRRVENLRVWAAALKFRYLISFDPARVRGGSKPVTAPEIGFDARAVGRREAGWEGMIEHAVEKWVEAVVKEVREGDE